MVGGGCLSASHGSDCDGVMPRRHVWSALREKCSTSAGVVYVRVVGTLGPYLLLIMFLFCVSTFFFYDVWILATFDWRSSVYYFPS